MDQGKRSEPVELFAILILGFLLRLFAGRNSLTENGVLLPGYDEYYHMRRILFTANHFPNTLWFDSYLNYPHGFDITWPPLFDQISAALCVVLGQHSKAGVEMTASFVPMIIGIIAIVVVYYLVRELFNHKVALLAAFMTALAPFYLLYTMFAALDHHCLEVLLTLITLLFIIMAIRRSEKRYLFASVAGVAMAALAYTWQGADIYMAIFLLYAAVQMTLDLHEGKSSKETATILLAAFAIAFILILPFSNTSWLSASFKGIGAIIIALSIMFALTLIIAKMKISWKAFPLSILILFALFALLSQFAGGLFGVGAMIQSGLEYVWGGRMIGKISEAEPLFYDAETFSQVVFSKLGLNILFSLVGMAALLDYIRRSTGAKRQGQILLLLWAAVTLILTLGQSRFLYISTIYMGLMISMLFFFLIDLAEKMHKEGKLAWAAKSPRLLAAILLLLLVLPTAWDAASFAQSTPPVVAGDWEESLAWLKENSETTSFFAAPQEIAEYSVMSWWDYGNWILYLAERPVVANNFQAGVADAAKFYLSESEEEAMGVLDARGSRYIFADYKLIYGKLAALTNWANEDLSSYMKMEDYGLQTAVTPKQRLFNTTLGRLYFFDGAGTGHFRLVHESKTMYGEKGQQKSEVKIFEYVPGALIKIRTGPDQKVGGLLNMTSNQGRPFIYVNEAKANADSFEIRVPYSTENRYGCHAINPYLIFSGNKDAVKMKNLNVSEEDVIKGRTIELTF